MSEAGPLVVGWKERVSLPELGIRRLIAKIDTGARTSSLHVEEIEELSAERLRFQVMLHRHDEDVHVWAEAPFHRIARVRPSTGEVQQRYVIVTSMRLGPVRKTIEISLVSRRNMYCRMLVGRTALAGDFVVDAAARYLQKRRPRGEAPPKGTA